MAKIRRQKEVQRMLDEAQSRAKERTINMEQLENILQTAEERILLCSTKKDAYGTAAICDYHMKKYPHAYKYTPQSTKVYAEYTPDGWLISEVWRGNTGSGNSHYIVIAWSEAAMKNMARKLGTLNDWRG